jgi:hypothetical protein
MCHDVNEGWDQAIDNCLKSACKCKASTYRDHSDWSASTWAEKKPEQVALMGMDMNMGMGDFGMGGGSSSSIKMDISGGSPGQMPPKPTHTAKPNNGGWGVPCNQYCRANCYDNFKDDTDMYKNARIQNCMIYSCACDLSLFGFGQATAGPNGSSASIDMGNGQSISGSATAGGFGGNDWNSGSSSSSNWNTGSSSSSSSWNTDSSTSSSTNWNSGSSSDWGNSGSSSIHSSSSTGFGNGGSSSMNIDSSVSTGGAGGDVSSSINMDGTSISANAGGASAKIDMSGFPTGGAMNYTESGSGSWN